MPRLTEQEKQEILRYIEADKPLPDKSRFLLFADKREVELVWNGKTSEVSNIVLPFQVIRGVGRRLGSQSRGPVLRAFGSGRQGAESNNNSALLPCVPVVSSGCAMLGSG